MICLFLLLTATTADLVADVHYAFEDDQFRTHSKTINGQNVSWGDITQHKFDQRSSGLCTLYAASAVSRQPISVEAFGNKLVIGGQLADAKEVVQKGAPNLPVVKDVLPLHSVERVHGDIFPYQQMGADYAKLLSGYMTQYADKLVNGQSFKGFLLAKFDPVSGNGHTIGMPYKDGDGYRVFDSYAGQHVNFEKNDLCINTFATTPEEVQAAIEKKWSGKGLQEFRLIVAVFGPVTEAPAGYVPSLAAKPAAPAPVTPAPAPATPAPAPAPAAPAAPGTGAPAASSSPSSGGGGVGAGGSSSPSTSSPTPSATPPSSTEADAGTAPQAPDRTPSPAVPITIHTEPVKTQVSDAQRAQLTTNVAKLLCVAEADVEIVLRQVLSATMASDPAPRTDSVSIDITIKGCKREETEAKLAIIRAKMPELFKQTLNLSVAPVVTASVATAKKPKIVLWIVLIAGAGLLIVGVAVYYALCNGSSGSQECELPDLESADMDDCGTRGTATTDNSA